MSLEDLNALVKKHTNRALWVRVHAKNRALRDMEQQVRELACFKDEHNHSLASIKAFWDVLGSEVKALAARYPNINALQEGADVLAPSDSTSQSRSPSSGFLEWIVKDLKKAGLSRASLTMGDKDKTSAADDDEEDDDDDFFSDEEDEKTATVHSRNLRLDMERVLKYSKLLDKQLACQRQNVVKTIGALVTALEQQSTKVQSLLDAAAQQSGSTALSEATAALQSAESRAAHLEKTSQTQTQKISSLEAKLVTVRAYAVDALARAQKAEQELELFRRQKDRSAFAKAFPNDVPSTAPSTSTSSSSSSLSSPTSSSSMGDSASPGGDSTAFFALQEQVKSLTADAAELKAQLAQKEEQLTKTLSQLTQTKTSLATALADLSSTSSSTSSSSSSASFSGGSGSRGGREAYLSQELAAVTLSRDRLASDLSSLEAARRSEREAFEADLASFKRRATEADEQRREQLRSATARNLELVRERDGLHAALQALQASGSELKSADYRARIVELEGKVKELAWGRAGDVDPALRDRNVLLRMLVALRRESGDRILELETSLALVRAAAAGTTGATSSMSDVQSSSLTSASASSSSPTASSSTELVATIKRLQAEIERLKAERKEHEGKTRAEWEEEALASKEVSDALSAELDAMGPSLEAAQAESARLRQQLRDLDATFNKLTEKSFLTSHSQSLMREQMDALTHRLVTLAERVRVQEELVAVADTRVSTLTEELSRAQSARREAVQQLDKERSTVRELQEVSKSAQESKESAARQIETMRTAMVAEASAAEGLQKKVFDLQSEVTSLQHRNDKLKRKVQDAGAHRLPGDDKALLEELRQVKSKLRCSVCSVRDKDTVITKCFHTFCRTCVNHNLESRQRKCPNCTKPFGLSDVQTIFLT